MFTFLPNIKFNFKTQVKINDNHTKVTIDNYCIDYDFKIHIGGGLHNKNACKNLCTIFVMEKSPESHNNIIKTYRINSAHEK